MDGIRATHTGPAPDPAEPDGGTTDRAGGRAWVDGFPPDCWYADGPDDEPWDHPGGECPPEPQWALAASARVERELLADAASGHPGGWSAGILARWCPHGREGKDLAGLDANGLLDGIAGLQRLIGWAQAGQQRYLAALARPGVAAPLHDAIDLAASPLGIARDVPDAPAASLLNDPAWGPAIRDAAIKIAATEVGCLLRVAPVTARARTERAVVMLDALPDTLAAQQAGDLDSYRACIIADRTAILTPQQRHLVEQRVLPVADQRTPGRLRDLLDREVNRIDPDAAAKREQHARRGRGVHLQPGTDGMATIRADITAPDAQISHTVLDRIARGIQAAGLAAGRGRSQIRADVFTDIFQHLAATGHVSIDQPGTPTHTHTSTGAGTDADTGTGTGTKTDADTATGTDEDTGTGTDDDTGTGTGSGGAATGPDATAGGTADHPDTDPDQRQDADRHRHTAAPGTPHDSGQDDAAVIQDFPGIAGDAATDAGAAAQAMWQAAADRGNGPTSPPGTAGAARAARPGWVMPICVNVYVNASTLTGRDDDPAELAGHGVISAEFARALAESAGTIRAITTQTITTADPPDTPTPGHSPPGEWTTGGHSTHPVRSRVCGTVLDAGRIRYRPGTAAADYITTRDRICAFPGCRARAETCDLDHRLPWNKHAATCPCNNDPLCRYHHALKTFTRWQATPGIDGSLTWTSPTKHHYPTEPAHLLTDHPPDTHTDTHPPDDDPPPF